LWAAGGGGGGGGGGRADRDTPRRIFSVYTTSSVPYF
jgi:hypothetical protein